MIRVVPRRANDAQLRLPAGALPPSPSVDPEPSGKAGPLGGCEEDDGGRDQNDTDDTHHAPKDIPAAAWETYGMPKAALGLVLVVGGLLTAACGRDEQAATTSVPTTTTLAPIVVESPADHAVVSPTFVVRGTASVFEATLVVELRRDGDVLERQTVTASEGAPARGSFTATLHSRSGGAATVVAFAPNAADGSPQHVQTVPVVVR